MLREFEPKKRVLRAAQYTDDASGLLMAKTLASQGLSVEWTATGYRSKNGELIVQSEPSLTLVINFSTKRVRLDNWVVINSDGEVKIYTNEEFEKLYTLSSETSDDAN